MTLGFLIIIIIIIILYSYLNNIYRKFRLEQIQKKCYEDSEIKNIIDKNTNYIENGLNNIINEYVKNDELNYICKYSLDGGKKIRSLIGYSIYYNINPSYDVNMINCVELLHTSSLILDDIMDCDKMRRNKKSLYYKFGIAKAQLAASQLVLTSSQLINNEILGINKNINNYVLHIFQNLINGQFDDISKKSKDIIKTSIEKTSSLFQLLFALSFGDKLTEDNLPILNLIGIYFGLIYQIADDFSDYYSDKNNNIVQVLGYKKSIELFDIYITELYNLLVYMDILTYEIYYIMDYLYDLTIKNYNYIKD